MRVADFIAKKFRLLGITHAYMVTGGAAMHLNDAISREYYQNLHFLHHEQSCSMAAEAYARITNKPCLVNVTAGPGAINAINGVFGAYVDSLPMIVISGQSKRQTLALNSRVKNLRQLGDQEVNIIEMVSNVCKRAFLLQEPLDIDIIVNQAFLLATSGRPGPVWIDIPIDVQASILPEHYESLLTVNTSIATNLNETSSFSSEDMKELAFRLLTEERPILYVGNGVRLSDSYSEFLDFLVEWPIACVTGWNSNDLLWDEHPCYCGRPGTIGNRSGNFAIQFSRCLLTVGSRLNIRQISYNWNSFAENAWKCHVDIDQAELDKPTLSTNLKINSDIKGFFPLLSAYLQKVSASRQLDVFKTKQHWSDWRLWLRSNLRKYSALKEALPPISGNVNPYRLIHEVSKLWPEDSVCVCSDGTACVVGFQAAIFKKGQRMFHNSGCASMGYELPACIGAFHATNKPVTCLAGDGSIMMNIQELSIVGLLNLPIKIILLNNNGYHSIRQTQATYFPDNLIGCGPESRLPFPDFSYLCKASCIKYSSISEESLLVDALQSFYSTNEPELLEVFIDRRQIFSPKIASKKLSTGEMISSSFEDMSPHLDLNELKQLRSEAESISL